MDLKMFDNFQPKGAHQKRKLTRDILKKNGKKHEKSKILDVLLTGPRDPRYGSDNFQKNLNYFEKNKKLDSSKISNNKFFAKFRTHDMNNYQINQNFY